MCRDFKYDCRLSKIILVMDCRSYLLGVNCVNFNGSSFCLTTNKHWSSTLRTMTVLSSLSRNCSMTSVAIICNEWTIGCFNIYDKHTTVNDDTKLIGPCVRTPPCIGTATTADKGVTQCGWDAGINYVNKRLSRNYRSPQSMSGRWPRRRS